MSTRDTPSTPATGRLAGADAARFERQVLLPRVGVAGQRAIMAARVAVGGSGLAHELASLYVRRAGVTAVDPGPIEASDEGLVVDPAARAVLVGSRAAVAALRHVLGDAHG